MKSSKGDSDYIDKKLIAELVYHSEKYIREFAEASEHSFTEFRDKYAAFLLDRDETNFRKAGHKIKPVAQMLNIDEIVEEYEYAKTLLWEKKGQEELQKSVDRVKKICDSIIKELRIIQEEKEMPPDRE